jgi:hypothetical protein
MTNTRESSDPVFRRLVDGGLLYDADHECIHHLNETATLICESWRQGMSQEDIVRLLRERYEVETAVALDHVRLTIERLQGRLSTG